MPTDRLLVGSVAISARPGPTLTAVVGVKVAAQANTVVASLGVASGGRGRTNGRTRAYINKIDVTDPHVNFTVAEWEKLGTMRGVVLQMRESGSRGGRGGNDTQSLTNSTPQRTASVVSVNGGTTNENATTNQRHRATNSILSSKRLDL
jgi:hypothetical protein